MSGLEHEFLGKVIKRDLSSACENTQRRNKKWPAPEKVDGSKVEFWGVEGRQNEHEEESIQ